MVIFEPAAFGIMVYALLSPNVSLESTVRHMVRYIFARFCMGRMEMIRAGYSR